MDSSELPDWLSKKIKEKGINQSQLATRSGVSRQTISDYVNRKRPYPDERTLIKLAEGLGESPETILSVAGLLPPNTELTSLQQRALHYLSQLHPEDQERVMLYLEVLASRYKYTGQRP
jgi:transcriptional regulator with XRE-family HTH domain